MTKRLRLCSFPGIEHYRIRIPTDRHACNPSIVADEGGYRAIVRTVSYTLDTYDEVMLRGGLDTINWLVRFDANLQILDARRIDDRKCREQDERAASGFEDARLFFWQGGWWYSASGLAPGYPPYRVTMSLNHLDGAAVAESTFIPSPKNAPMEKNWMPVVTGEELSFIYRASPMQRVRAQNSSFDFSEEAGDARMLGWSGSSQCIVYRSRRLCVVHRTVLESGRRVYEHAFLELDENFRIVRVSPSWYFDKETVEFCAGLCVTSSHAILSYGFEDGDARLLKIPLRIVERLLESGIASRTTLQLSYLAGRLKNRIWPLSIVELTASGVKGKAS